MYCRKCGTKLKEEALFCHNCGMKIASEYVEQQVKINTGNTPGTVPGNMPIPHEEDFEEKTVLLTPGNVAGNPTVAKTGNTPWTVLPVNEGNTLGTVPPVNIGNTPRTVSEGGTKKKSKKSLILILVIVFLCFSITSAVAVIALKTDLIQKITQRKVAETQSEESIEMSQEENLNESMDVEKESEDIAVLGADIERLYELKGDVEALEDITNVEETFNEVRKIYSTYQENEDVRKASKEIYDIYYGKVVEYIDMIKGIEQFNIAHYQECILRYDDLNKWNEALNCGYEEELTSSRDLCKKEYKNKYVKRFDEECLRTLEENGVISRTVAWGVLEGIENTDLYNAANVEDEDYRYDTLRLRYIVAKVYKIHKDINGMDVDNAINMIKDSMVECGYDPMLVYLLEINGYEPAQVWMDEIEDILFTYMTEGNKYRSLDDATRLNFVYLYNVEIQDYKECKDKIMEYMKENYY